MEKRNFRFKTDLHCCSIETIEDCNENKKYLCGFYELNEETSIKTGGIGLYEENQQLQFISVNNGMLDMKLSENVLGCALSNGDIILYDYSASNTLHLNELIRNEEGRNEGIALSLSWENTIKKSKLAVSTESGALLFYSLTSSALQLTSTISNAHQFQSENIPAWIVSYSQFNDSLVVSGGDDCCMKLWDLNSPSSPIFKSSKHYSAGVTSAQWHPFNENLFAVGSYDQSFKIWDLRSLKHPLSEIETSGGVWRIKWNRNAQNCNYLAIASMQGGSGVYHWNEDTSQIEIIDLQCDDSSNRLIYGIDWIENSSKEEEREGEKSFDWSIVTCSFYDNLVQKWSSSSSSSSSLS